MLGDLLAAQTGMKATDAMIFAPSIRALTHFCPTGWSTPDVWHLSQGCCPSYILKRDASLTR
jgi:hypothetical protein